MATASYTRTILASPEDVWAVVGDFGALHTWHPLVPDCSLDEDGITRLINAGGMIVAEVLQPEACPERGHVYTVDRSPMPVRSYRALVQAIKVPVGTALHYEAEFEPVGVTAKEAAEMLTGFFRIGFDAVARQIEAG